MLPLVLGGIALAAVGYGVKEYCENEGCPWDDSIDYTPSTPATNTFKSLHEKKLLLYENNLLQLRVLLLKVEKVDEKLKFNDTVNIVEEKLSEEEVEEDVKLYAGMYEEILDTSSYLLDDFIGIVKMILSKEIKYSNFNKSEQKVLKKAYKTVNSVQKLLGLKLLNDKVLDIDVISNLKNLKLKIDNLMLESND
jgi:hypothetical protein